MDRRQKKSRQAIIEAFTRLLEKENFSSITVQQIIDEADVGRTTFYAHFETKDILLKEMCTEIIEHIFSHELHPEYSHDFSAGKHDLQERLTHLLYHLKENKGNITALFSGSTSELFLRYFKELLQKVFEEYPEVLQPDVPHAFAISHATGSFTEAVRYWIHSGMAESPEDIASYFIKCLNI